MNSCVAPILIVMTIFNAFTGTPVLFIKEIAATCLFLASKTEENGKRLDDLVTVALAKLHSVNPNEVAGKYDKVMHPYITGRISLSLSVPLRLQFPHDLI